jgi:hypothetical protein
MSSCAIAGTRSFCGESNSPLLDVHAAADWHVGEDGAASLHVHEHAVAGRTALLLILGSSPMVEGIPAFFAASTYGVPLLATMAAVFAAAPSSRTFRFPSPGSRDCSASRWVRSSATARSPAGSSWRLSAFMR